MSIFHFLYGLKIASSLPLPGLPAQPRKSQQVDVQIRLKENSEFLRTLFELPNDYHYTSPDCGTDGDPNLRVGTLASGKYYGFFYSDGARFAVSHEGREIWADWPENYTLEDTCTYLIGPVIAFVLRLRGAVCLHASSISIGGRALALLGAPGAGKSTTAAGFAGLGYTVVSDDVVVLADEGIRFLVQPGYPRINLWPDSVRVLFGSEDALPKITPTWGKRYLALDQSGHRFQSGPLPLRAIYILGEREAGLTSPVIEELSGSAALTSLIANTYVHYLLDRDMQRRDFDVLSRVVAHVPVRKVRPVADPTKLSALCESIAADARETLIAESQSGS